jgi:hypothetical protein
MVERDEQAGKRLHGLVVQLAGASDPPSKAPTAKETSIMAIDWMTASTRGIGNPSSFVPPNVTSQGYFPQSGFVNPSLVPLSALSAGSMPPFAAPYASPYGPGYVDPIGAGYGFTPYWLNPYATPFGPAAPFNGFSPNPYATGSQMGDHLTDQDIEKQAEDILGLDPLTCNADIQVQCQDHVITLTGTVTGRLVKIAAGNDCWVVPGVRDVNNSIQIKSRSAQGQKQRQAVGAGSR